MTTRLEMDGWMADAWMVLQPQFNHPSTVYGGCPAFNVRLFFIAGQQQKQPSELFMSYTALPGCDATGNVIPTDVMSDLRLLSSAAERISTKLDTKCNLPLLLCKTNDMTDWDHRPTSSSAPVLEFHCWCGCCGWHGCPRMDVTVERGSDKFKLNLKIATRLWLGLFYWGDTPQLGWQDTIFSGDMHPSIEYWMLHCRSINSPFAWRSSIFRLRIFPSLVHIYLDIIRFILRSIIDQ